MSHQVIFEAVKGFTRSCPYPRRAWAGVEVEGNGALIPCHLEADIPRVPALSEGTVQQLYRFAGDQDKVDRSPAGVVCTVTSICRHTSSVPVRYRLGRSIAERGWNRY